MRDDGVRAVVRALLARDDDGELLAYRAGAGWCDVRSADINAYLREVSGIEISAKDFRTWNGTVLAAVVLAAGELEARGKRTNAARRSAVSRAMKEVSGYLGNTATVARTSYVDPRVVDLFGAGATIAPTLRRIGGAPEPDDAEAQQAVETAVLDLLRGQSIRPAYVAADDDALTSAGSAGSPR